MGAVNSPIIDLNLVWIFSNSDSDGLLVSHSKKTADNRDLVLHHLFGPVVIWILP